MHCVDPMSAGQSPRRDIGTSVHVTMMETIVIAITIGIGLAMDDYSCDQACPLHRDHSSHHACAQMVKSTAHHIHQPYPRHTSCADPDHTMLSHRHRMYTASTTWITPTSDNPSCTPMPVALRTCRASSCSYVASGPSALARHVAACHPREAREAMQEPRATEGGRKWRALCRVCLGVTTAGRKGNVILNRSTHERKHTGGWFECGLELPGGGRCGHRASQPGDLRRHMQGHAMDRPVWVCPWEGCSYADMQKGSMRRHIRTVHVGERRHMCGVCGSAFG